MSDGFEELVRAREFAIQTQSEMKEKFGSKLSYIKQNLEDEFGGFGYFRTDEYDNAVMRGGSLYSDNHAGIFATLSYHSSATNQNLGFRCMYAEP